MEPDSRISIESSKNKKNKREKKIKYLFHNKLKNLNSKQSMFFIVQYPIVVNSFPDREMSDQDVDIYFQEFQAVLDADQKFILQIELDGLKNPEWAFLKRMVEFLKKNKPISARLLMGTGIVVTTKFRKAAISFILQFYKANSEVRQFDSSDSCKTWCMSKAKETIDLGVDSNSNSNSNSVDCVPMDSIGHAPQHQNQNQREPWFYVIQEYIYTLLDHWAAQSTVNHSSHLDAQANEWYFSFAWARKETLVELVQKKITTVQASTMLQPNEIHDFFSLYNLVNCVEMVWNSEELSMVSSLSSSNNSTLIPFYIGFCMIHQTPVGSNVSTELVSQIREASWNDAVSLGAK